MRRLQASSDVDSVCHLLVVSVKTPCNLSLQGACTKISQFPETDCKYFQPCDTSRQFTPVNCGSPRSIVPSYRVRTTSSVLDGRVDVPTNFRCQAASKVMTSRKDLRLDEATSAGAGRTLVHRVTCTNLVAGALRSTAIQSSQIWKVE